MLNRINIIVEEPVDNMDGHINIKIEDIDKITNGYVNNILFNSIDKIDQKNRNIIFVTLLKKLTRGGSITTKFINPESVGKRIKSAGLSSEMFMSYVANLKSVWMETEFLELISTMTDCSLIKHIHDDINSIVVITKNK